MRTSVFALPIVVLATLLPSVHAEDDFSALLADLTFGDAPAAAEPLAVVPTEPVEELKPVPSFQMPGVPQTAELPSHQAAELPMLDAPVAVTPRVALQDPVPAAKAPQLVDFNAAFAAQAPAMSVQSQLAGHRLHSVGCDTGCNPTGHCNDGIICRPRTKVNLPSSTFYQYFRSDACYTNVWDGYHRKCPRCHKHIHGTCDCFNRNLNANCGEVIDCAPVDCASCDGTCD